MLKPSDAIEIVEIAEEYFPVVKKAIPLIKKLGKEFKPLMDALSDNFVDSNVRCIKRYQDNGFTRDEAILMTISTRVSIQEAVRNMNKK